MHSKIKQPNDLRLIAEVIQLVKSVKSIEELSGIKKLNGFDDAFRIRTGNYRIRVFIDGDVVQFARVLHPMDIYKIFP